MCPNHIAPEHSEFQLHRDHRRISCGLGGVRAIAGFRHRMPGFLRSSFTLDSEGDGRMELAKSFDPTKILCLFGGIEYDTSSEWRSNIGEEYILIRSFSAVTSYDSDHGFGAGIEFRF